MPSHSVISTGTDIAIAGSVNAAPFGQAGIASIPWMFINMLGEEGLRASAEMAILNANYMAARLKVRLLSGIVARMMMMLAIHLRTTILSCMLTLMVDVVMNSSSIYRIYASTLG